MRGKHRKTSRTRKALEIAAGSIALELIAAIIAAGAVLTLAGLLTGAPAQASTRPAHPDRATCRAFSRWYDVTEYGYRPWLRPGLVELAVDRAAYAGPELMGMVDSWAKTPGRPAAIDGVVAVCLDVTTR